MSALPQSVANPSCETPTLVLVSYQQRIPDDLLGRVNSVYRFFGWAAMPVGAIAAAALVSMLEPTCTVALQGLYLLGALVSFGLLSYDQSHESPHFL